MEEKSIKEIEQIMDIPSATVRSHLHRGRGRLKEFMESGK
jgi:DNA-directed RNA polymerase specialized sigma24 family protein